MFYWICWIIAVPFVFLLFPLRIMGRKYFKITKGQSKIVCANHQTNNDAVILDELQCSENMIKHIKKSTIIKFALAMDIAVLK